MFWLFFHRVLPFSYWYVHLHWDWHLFQEVKSWCWRERWGEKYSQSTYPKYIYALNNYHRRGITYHYYPIDANFFVVLAVRQNHEVFCISMQWRTEWMEENKDSYIQSKNKSMYMYIVLGMKDNFQGSSLIAITGGGKHNFLFPFEEMKKKIRLISILTKREKYKFKIHNSKSGKKTFCSSFRWFTFLADIYMRIQSTENKPPKIST